MGKKCCKKEGGCHGDGLEMAWDGNEMLQTGGWVSRGWVGNGLIWGTVAKRRVGVKGIGWKWLGVQIWERSVAKRRVGVKGIAWVADME